MTLTLVKRSLLKKTCIFIVLFFLIKLSTYTLVPLISKAYDIFMLGIIALYFLLCWKRISASKVTFLVAFMYGFIVISTLVNDMSYLFSAIATWVRMTFLCLFIENELKKHPKLLFDAASALLFLLMAINFVTVILFPDGMYSRTWDLPGGGTWNDSRYWFLGFKNFIGKYAVVAICLRFAGDIVGNNHRRLSFYCLCAMSMLCALLVESWTSSIVIGITVTVCFIAYNGRFVKEKVKRGILGPYAYLITFVFLFVFFVFCDSSILELTGRWFPEKYESMSVRTVIWDNSKDLITDSPILGYGLQSRDWHIDHLGLGLGSTARHAVDSHNFILIILMRGGLCSIAAFAAVMVVCTNALHKVKATMLSKVVSFSIFMFFIISLFEDVETSGMWIVFLPLANMLPILAKQTLQKTGLSAEQGRE